VVCILYLLHFALQNTRKIHAKCEGNAKMHFGNVRANSIALFFACKKQS
jgi:hypothetical protein